MRPNNKPWTREHPDLPPYRAPRADAGLGELPGELPACGEIPLAPCRAHDAVSADIELDQQALRVQKAVKDLIRMTEQEPTEERILKIVKALFS